MSAEKKKIGKKKKDSQLIIRINTEERDRFVSLCDELDTSAAREIRRFIKTFVAGHTPEKQQEN
ncbi:MAG: hypothetical protein C0622_01665 [Desulfuromonas sp.]|nr:MAG: hypothetical protein C0622_01665 [Desulfuromonas sp.]